MRNHCNALQRLDVLRSWFTRDLAMTFLDTEFLYEFLMFGYRLDGGNSNLLRRGMKKAQAILPWAIFSLTAFHHSGSSAKKNHVFFVIPIVSLINRRLYPYAVYEQAKGISAVFVSGVDTDDIKMCLGGGNRLRQDGKVIKAPLHVRLVECLTAMSMFGNGAVLQHPQCHYLFQT
jgi:hypothetical protein